jgi:hypothetical protein
MSSARIKTMLGFSGGVSGRFVSGASTAASGQEVVISETTTAARITYRVFLLIIVQLLAGFVPPLLSV